ncbi:hypothetical protein ACFSQP_06730 [Bizionia sediminis]|uniref:DUF4175 family protein n=1 Tax=Bizionia sediminis TaxID=1737064 RepID=A0ABW5KSA0_9FLAO
MTHFNLIVQKLEAFVKRYYTNELIRGSILFFAIGFLYFLFTVFIEYVFWFSTTTRTVLFWAFVGVEVALFVKFIAIPLAQLFKLKSGIDYVEASKIIGKHFPEVNDKLINVLQLQAQGVNSELLLASINQKSKELQPIPFKLAINFKQNIKFLKYAAIPVAIILLSVLFGKQSWFSDGYKRVVNHDVAYQPPAPFQFFVLNDKLEALENSNFKLQVTTQGRVVPENVSVVYNNETYVLQQTSVGMFEYVFNRLQTDVNFQLVANGVFSKTYRLNVVAVPSIVSFQMRVNYPKYLNKANEVFKGTGNATVPEGTNVVWELQTKATEEVVLYAADTLQFTKSAAGRYQLEKKLHADLDYLIAASNASLQDFEQLAFSLNVIKDANPELRIKMAVDSSNQQDLYFYGQALDDHGLKRLQLIYYPENQESNSKSINLTIGSGTVAEFITAFPDNLELEAGVVYQLFFKLTDNDVVNGYKSVNSRLYSYRKLTKDELVSKQLSEQNETIKDLNKSLERMEDREQELESFSKVQKEKSELSFNDKKKFENFIKRQKEQEALMKNFNKKLEENLEEFQKDRNEADTFKEDLKERLKENEAQLKKDEKLLEELEKLQDKINKEELTEKLEQLAKQNKNQKRSLEQLLELTKRYYVAKKMEKLQQDLERLAKEQEQLAESTESENTKKAQDSLNKSFQDFQKAMDALEKDNEQLKQPMDLPADDKKEADIKEDQEEAAGQLGKKEDNEAENNESEAEKNLKKAQQKQRQAAQKMKQMAQQMSMSMQASGGEQMEEDLEMLRQILDNLILFSFDQEALMDQFKAIEINHNKYAGYLRKQNDLKEHFSHIDDSLFALSLRQPKLSEMVNKEISEVFFNMNKALDQFSENRLYQGVANQQYTVTAANNLANLLSDLMNQMQMQMQMSGSGSGGKPEQGLPDIIKSQEELNKEMENGMQKSDSGSPKDSGEGNQKGDKEGEEGKRGKAGSPETAPDGTHGKGDSGDGTDSEISKGELFRIYQRQQEIRQALEDKLAKDGLQGVGKTILRDMEQVEMDLLNKGMTNRTLQRMMNLQHQLMKLENAALEQGQDTKRESEANKKEYNNRTNSKVPKAQEYFNTMEILNRQSLPLQPEYRKKVQEYFKNTND